MTADTRPSDAGLARRPGWHAPHLLAGRSRAADLGLGLLILIGATADLVAFKTTLDILLRQPEPWPWVMAAGATCLALVIAAWLGIAIAVRRREDTRYASFAVAVAAIAWLGLGIAMFIARALGSGSAVPVFATATPQPTQHTVLIAIFFLFIYLASGTCMVIEAQRLHNPEATLHRRLAKHLDKQVLRTAKAEAVAARAQEVVNLHGREMAREVIRYRAAIDARKALAGRLASYARILMAGELGDPSKTAVTQIEPVLELPSAVDKDGNEDNGDPDRHDS